MEDWSELCCGACGSIWDAPTPNGYAPTDCPFCGDEDSAVVMEEDDGWPVSRNSLADDARIAELGIPELPPGLA